MVLYIIPCRHSSAFSHSDRNRCPALDVRTNTISGEALFGEAVLGFVPISQTLEMLLEEKL
jgi:hypothetical protein